MRRNAASCRIAIQSWITRSWSKQWRPRLLAGLKQIGVDSTYWTAVNQFFIWGSLAVYFTITFTMYSDGMYLIFTASFPFIGTARNSLTQPSVWLSVFLTTILCVLPVVAYRFFMVMLRPNFSDKLNYMISKSKKRPPPEQRRARLRRVSSRRSSYAFSHQQGFGALIMSGRNMRPRTAPAASSRVIDRSNTAAAAAGSSSRSANATMRNVIVDGS
ncbi:probable phospholipid-transporting ATPase IM [Latimeria chalumnae]|uniref:probable phospholipid-transporting ATPase IM n=1 Tax=Latimeria chalumnae TaxID=7897 RepID=UPI00313F1219